MNGNASNDLEWRDDNLPVSRRFDDPYYSREDGRAETDHVFIRGNRLPERWLALETCTIAELGFGTGLNFLETVRQWQMVRKTDANLNFISFEQFPITKAEMQKALLAWSQLGHLSERLTRFWPPQSDLLAVEFDERIQLTVYMGDANRKLPMSDFNADAWYLDGFSPAKNLELWNANLMHEVARHTVVGGTFATYTAAGFVRRNLRKSGFEVTKTNGYGRKRDMLVGKKRGDIHVADRH